MASDPFHPSNLHSLELVHHTLSFLHASKTILSRASTVSKSWLGHCLHNNVWKMIVYRDYMQETKEVPVSDLLARNAGMPIMATSTTLAYRGGIDYEKPTKLIAAALTFRAAWECWERLKTRISTHERYADILVQNDIATLFMRAAHAWERVLEWNAQHMPCLLKTDPARSTAAQLCPGEYFDNDNPVFMSAHSEVKIWFACVNGQTWVPSDMHNQMNMHTFGQIGGFHVYGEYQCSVLLDAKGAMNMRNALKLAEREPSDGVCLVPLTKMCSIYQSSQLFRFPCVNLQDASMYYVCIEREDPHNYCCVPMVRRQNRNGHKIHILDWWEEFSKRLSNGCYTVGTIFGHDHPSKLGLDLFPRTAPLMVVAETQGIRVEASTIHLANPHMGWVYSIRMKLVDVTKLPGWSSSSSIFGAQLMLRHWIITNGETGVQRHVDGPGVVGLFPILHTNGYLDVSPHHNTNDIVDRDGWFIYQSLSGSVPYGSTFGGSLTFVVNKDREDHSNNGHPQTTFSMASTGTFEVAVPTFVLSSQEYYY
jgi:hypothetical protein